MALKDRAKKMKGKNKREAFLFSLSTCPWCTRTKMLLGELEIEYSYLDVDTLDDGGKEEAKKEIKKYEDSFAFPLLIVGKSCLGGYDEKKMRELLK